MTTRIRRRSISPVGATSLIAIVLAPVVSVAVPGQPGLHRPVVDAGAPANDPVQRLQERLDGGATLAFDSVHGYLPALLEALDIEASSQTLVFSRTSFQTDRIGPWAPRALYFNDDVYVGWVNEGPILELAVMAAGDGARFYTLVQQSSTRPAFSEEGDTCLLCHDSRITERVPGLIMRSTLTDRFGYPVTEFHSGSTRDQTPFDLRWGGWYVTGSHGDQVHAGNLRSNERFEDITFPTEHRDALDRSAGANVQSVEDQFDATGYLTPHSDIVALMVLAHQVRVHNLMSLVDGLGVRAMGNHPPGRPGARYSPLTAPASGTALDRLFRAMLFVDEARLEHPVRGTSSFAEDFEARGPRDASGRSLRELDLETRLFRHPLSYLIYTPSFDALPAFARAYVYDGILEALTTDALPDAFRHLADVDRGAVLALLEATKPEFAARVRETASGTP